MAGGSSRWTQFVCRLRLPKPHISAICVELITAFTTGALAVFTAFMWWSVRGSVHEMKESNILLTRQIELETRPKLYLDFDKTIAASEGLKRHFIWKNYGQTAASDIRCSVIITEHKNGMASIEESERRALCPPTSTIMLSKTVTEEQQKNGTYVHLVCTYTGVGYEMDVECGYYLLLGTLFMTGKQISHIAWQEWRLKVPLPRDAGITFYGEYFSVGVDPDLVCWPPIIVVEDEALLKELYEEKPKSHKFQLRYIPKEN